MTTMTSYPAVGVAGFRRALETSLAVCRPVLILGYPGVGKTAIVGQFAKAVGLPIVYFDIGNKAREDIILPRVVGDRVETIPLKDLRRACDEAVVLFFDEVTRIDKNKLAICMALANERRIGDYSLHPGTVVVMAGNDSSSAGTYSLPDALVNRCCVLRFAPEREEIRAHSSTMGAEGTAKREIAELWSLAAGMRHEILQVEPPPGAQEGGQQWASPRAIEHAIDRLAVHWPDIDRPQLLGTVGEVAGIAFASIVAQRGKVPSAEQIAADPTGSALPPDLESAIAVAQNVVEAGRRTAEVWRYVDRLHGAFADAAMFLVRELQDVRARVKLPDPVGQKEAFRIFTALAGAAHKIRQQAR